MTLLFGLALGSAAHGQVRANDDVTYIDAIRLAMEFYKRKDWKTALELYRKAFAISRRPDCLFGAARSEHLGGQLAESRRDYELVRDMTTDADVLHAKAIASIAEIDSILARAAEASQRAPAQTTPVAGRPAAAESREAEAAKPTVAVTAPRVEPVPTLRPPSPPAAPPLSAAPTEPARTSHAIASPAPASTWRRPVGWGAVGLSGALAVTSAVLLATGSSDQSALNGLKLENGLFDPSQVSLDQAQSRQQSINGRVIAGWRLAGVAVASAAVGAWLLLTSPDNVVVAPTVNGLQVVGRF